MSADARLTAAALERLSDLEVAAALAEGTMLSANERGQTPVIIGISESARTKLGAVAEEQRARHAAVILLINRIRQWLREQGDVGFEDVDSPAVEQLAGAQLEAAIGSLRKAIRERQAEMGEAKGSAPAQGRPEEAGASLRNRSRGKRQAEARGDQGRSIPG